MLLNLTEDDIIEKLQAAHEKSGADDIYSEHEHPPGLSAARTWAM